MRVSCGILLRVVQSTRHEAAPTPLSARLSDGTNFVDDFQVLGAGTELTFTLTRPSDTNIYAANDAISSSTTSPTNPSIAGMARVNAGRGRITRVRVTTSQITFAGTIAIHVWHTNPTPINDNAAYAAVDSGNKCGTIFVSGFRTMGTGSAITEAEVDCNLTFKCASASTTLYYMMEAITAFTPASGQTFKAYFDVVEQ